MTTDPAVPLIRRLAAVFLFVAAIVMVAVLWMLRIRASDILGMGAGTIPQVVVGFLAMYIFCFATAPSVGVQCIKHPWIGGFGGIAILIIGTTAGSATSLFVYESLSVFDFMVKPLFWIVFYGAIPAFIIGLIGSITAKLLTKTIIRTERST